MAAGRDVSVALLLHDSRGGVWLGSAICLAIGERVLLATAAHNLDRVHYLRPIPGGRYRGDPLRPLGMSVRARGDVAWIEICADEARRRGLPKLDLADLAHEPLAERSRLLAHGFPAAGIDPRRLGSTRFELAAAQVAGHAAAHAVPGELALAWRRRDLPPAFSPTGLSGGGIYRLGDDGRQHLVGLARAWHGPSKLLFGTRIETWLRLVARDFPELAGLMPSVRA